MPGVALKEVNFEDKVRAGMNIVSGDEFHKNFVTVSKIAAEALSKTLGPYAHTTLIDDASTIYSTKDGWNIINRLQFGDALQNALFGLMKDISYHLVKTVGDGTTTAIVAANAMIQRLSRSTYADLISSSRQRDLLNSLDRVKKRIMSALESDKYLHYISNTNTFDDIYKIAMISSNENEEVSRIIQEIYCKTGNPNIHVTLGSGRSIKHEIQFGYRFDCKPRGLESFVNHDGKTYHGHNVRMAFFNHNVSFSEHREIVQCLMDIAVEYRTQILIFAPHFDDIVMGSMQSSMNQYLHNGQLPAVMPIQVPLTMEAQRYLFDDAAMITKSQIISPLDLKKILDLLHPTNEDGSPKEIDLQSQTVTMHTIKEMLKNEYIGYCPVTTVYDSYVLFEDFEKSEHYKNTLDQVKETYETVRAKAVKDMSPLNKEFMDASMRYVRLSGAMGIIEIGAESELEQRCMKDSVDDAVLACRSAFLNGYVKGLNLAIIGAANDVYKEIESELRENPSGSENEDLTIDGMMADLIEWVFRDVTDIVMHNKYPQSDMKAYIWRAHGSELDDPMTELSSTEIVDYAVVNNTGYNIVTETFSDELTVINSVKTDIEILSSMISIVSYAITSNQMLSLNRRFDTEIGKEMVNAADREKYMVMGNAFADVLKGLSILQTQGSTTQTCHSTIWNFLNSNFEEKGEDHK